MSRHGKVLQRVLSGLADQTVRFDELCALLARLAFVERQHGGSHRIFTRPGMTEIVNIQPRPDGTAKPYQVRQIRAIILKYGLAAGSEIDDA